MTSSHYPVTRPVLFSGVPIQGVSSTGKPGTLGHDISSLDLWQGEVKRVVQASLVPGTRAVYHRYLAERARSTYF